MSSSTLFRESETETHEGLDSVPSHVNRSSLLWLDIGRSPEELERAADVLALDESTTHALAETTTGPSVDDRPTYTHVTTRVPRRDADDGTLDQVDCVVGERWVLTVHEHPIAVLGDFRERASGSGSTGMLDGPAFLASLLEWVVAEYANAFDEIEAKLEELDVRALRGALTDTEDELRRLVDVRRDLGSLHRALGAHRRVLNALRHPEFDALVSGSAERFAALVDRYDMTVQAGRDSRSSIVASFEVLMARTEHQTNEILKVLTLVSVMLLPGALIAAVMGMNFDVPLFHHPNVFWVSLGAILAIMAGTASAARARHWI